MVLADDPPLYRDLMRLKPDDLTPNGWAVRAGVSRTVWTDMRRHGNPSRRTLEKLLAAVSSSLAEFEALRIGDPPRSVQVSGGQGMEDIRSAGWRGAPLAPIPLLASSAGGDWKGEGSQVELTHVDPARIIGGVARPASLNADRNAYAVTIVGDSMWPRFRPGRILLVSPAAPVSAGDDVLLRLNERADGREAVLIKEFVCRAPTFTELRQFNPNVGFKVEASAIAGIHRVMGEAI